MLRVPIMVWFARSRFTNQFDAAPEAVERRRFLRPRSDHADCVPGAAPPRRRLLAPRTIRAYVAAHGIDPRGLPAAGGSESEIREPPPVLRRSGAPDADHPGRPCPYAPVGKAGQ